MARTVFIFLLSTLLGATSMAQTPRTPDLEAQRTAITKLAFLVGEWSGEASVLRGPAKFVELVQTESAQFKLDGLLLVIEGLVDPNLTASSLFKPSDWFRSTMNQEPTGCELLTTDVGSRLRSNWPVKARSLGASHLANSRRRACCASIKR
jgi:hypothetical protein